MNGNNACDNSCYRVCKLWVFWAVCCAELLTCSAELPPQSSHSDRYSGSLVLSPRAKLKILGKTVEQHELPDFSFCTILFVTKMLDTNREKLRINYFLFWPCSMCAWLVLSKILVVYSGNVRGLVAVLQASLHLRSLKLLRTSMKLRVELHAEYNFKIIEQRSQAFSTWT